MSKTVYIDTEVGIDDHRVYDFGAVDDDNNKIHTRSKAEFDSFIMSADYICGHNIIKHDSKYTDLPSNAKLIDTLHLSPLLFPSKPYHSLLKDDKLQSNEFNNPLNDSIKAKELFYDELNAFIQLDEELKTIYYMLLKDSIFFSPFFSYIEFWADDDIETAILVRFSGRICENVPLANLIDKYPVELAYCLAHITATDEKSILPRWVLMTYPFIDNVLSILRGLPCGGCNYCRTRLNPIKHLSKYYGYDSFRTYNGEALQENAVNAAINQKSLLAIFPTGGGKSLTFQLPALIAGSSTRALTVVISPLQSLMKDQVDNLENKGIEDAVAINGLLSPIERANAIERVESGEATILYISPESLRSVTIERLLLSRRIDRFVIDEAHCFSAWGQDFRVDYLYIGDFIKSLQDKKGGLIRIPVSCFTATAKQKVVSDIKDYFKDKLDIDLELYTTDATRTNLRYEVLHEESDDDKYETLRNLIEGKNCPTIVYVSRTKRTWELAERLNKDGYAARPFNGKMDSSEKQKNQEAFINDEVQVIVATSAFGMGVDKSNVRLVIHYDISDSLENYVQEAGRAGRDESLDAECYVLFNDDDLDKHFMLLNQTRLSMSEIQQVWKAIKDLTRIRPEVCCSPLEIARQAGWNDSVIDIETRIKTAVQALENAGYIKRGMNAPRVYATSVLVKNMIEATERIESSDRFINDSDRALAKRIIQSLISSKSISEAGNDDAESRVDYIADRLGAEKSSVIKAIQQMREEGILTDYKDLSAYIYKADTVNKSMNTLKRFHELEDFLLDYIVSDVNNLSYKIINENAIESGIKTSSINNIRVLFYYWTIKGFVHKDQDMSSDKVIIVPQYDKEFIEVKRELCYKISLFIVTYLFDISGKSREDKEEYLVQFSVMELKQAYNKQSDTRVEVEDIEDALLFLSKIDAIKLDGGFLVLYSGLRIKRLILDNKIRYKKDDYAQLNEYYQQKIQQIHIVGEYANMMLRDYNEALQFVSDYFQMDYKKFLTTYFSEERSDEITRNITPSKYKTLFDSLSERQREIIDDKLSQYIVVAAGPGSGKTKVLVHKLASLMLMEDVKHEQLLMLTFSRAAVIEFQKRLHELIGNASYFVEIKTFHSYCFDLIGRVGNIENSENVVKEAITMLRNREADMGKVGKMVLVIDEAQDMDEQEFSLVETLMEYNDDMRVIAVGDDDQNIYQFRGADSKYLRQLVTEYYAKKYSLLDNYRSVKSIVAFVNGFSKSISERIKTDDINAVSDNNGEVTLVRHTGYNMEVALVDDMIANETGGSTCILTGTNKEAAIVLGILKHRGIPAKMIQSVGEFYVYNIAEIRYFLRILKTEESVPIISDETWNMAIDDLSSKYKDSESLPVVLNILNTFKEINNKKYRTDLELFLHESKLEDFYTEEQGVVTVSTIHKSKGREYDNVYMLVDGVREFDDVEKRKLYVGITRAKSCLHIHYSGNLLDGYKELATDYRIDNSNYSKPSEIIIQLSHRDVNLGFFKGKKKEILSLRSGYHLEVDGDKLYAIINHKRIAVLQYSAKCRDDIAKYKKYGYTPNDATIRYICSWKGKEDTEETAIILADIILKRR